MRSLLFLAVLLVLPTVQAQLPPHPVNVYLVEPEGGFPALTMNSTLEVEVGIERTCNAPVGVAEPATAHITFQTYGVVPLEDLDRTLPEHLCGTTQEIRFHFGLQATRSDSGAQVRIHVRTCPVDKATFCGPTAPAQVERQWDFDIAPQAEPVQTTAAPDKDAPATGAVIALAVVGLAGMLRARRS